MNSSMRKHVDICDTTAGEKLKETGGRFFFIYFGSITVSSPRVKRIPSSRFLFGKKKKKKNIRRSFASYCGRLPRNSKRAESLEADRETRHTRRMGEIYLDPMTHAINLRSTIRIRRIRD